MCNNALTSDIHVQLKERYNLNIKEILLRKELRIFRNVL